MSSGLGNVYDLVIYCSIKLIEQKDFCGPYAWHVFDLGKYGPWNLLLASSETLNLHFRWEFCGSSWCFSNEGSEMPHRPLWPTLPSAILALWTCLTEARASQRPLLPSLWGAGYEATLWNWTFEISVWHSHWSTLSLKRGQWKETCDLWPWIFFILSKWSTM